MRLLARWRQSWRRRPGRHAADPVVAPLVRLAQPRRPAPDTSTQACWCGRPALVTTWPYGPDGPPVHLCATHYGRGGRHRGELGIPRRRIVPAYYQAHERAQAARAERARVQSLPREEWLDEVRADLAPLVRQLLAQSDQAPTQPLEAIR